MSADEFARWLELHEPAPDEQDTEQATQPLNPVIIEHDAIETQEAFAVVDDETETIAPGFLRWFQVWRAFWHLRWGK